jgi:L-lactate dehydrogenase complex protein LldF
VKINIPEVLILLRGKVVDQDRKHLLDAEDWAMKAMSLVFSRSGYLNAAEHTAQYAQWPLVHDDTIKRLPAMLGRWTETRDLKAIPPESFRDWWKKRDREAKRSKEMKH